MLFRSVWLCRVRTIDIKGSQSGAKIPNLISYLSDSHRYGNPTVGSLRFVLANLGAKNADD